MRRFPNYLFEMHYKYILQWHIALAKSQDCAIKSNVTLGENLLVVLFTTLADDF